MADFKLMLSASLCCCFLYCTVLRHMSSSKRPPEKVFLRRLSLLRADQPIRRNSEAPCQGKELVVRHKQEPLSIQLITSCSIMTPAALIIAASADCCKRVRRRSSRNRSRDRFPFPMAITHRLIRSRQIFFKKVFTFQRIVL